MVQQEDYNERPSIYQKFMFPVELIIIFILGIGLIRLKSKLPDLFFPPTNVSVYLPPKAEDIAQKKTAKTQLQIQVLKSNAQTFISMPFTKDIETTVLFCMILAGQFIFVESLKTLSIVYLGQVLQDSGMISYFAFITLIMMISNVFKAATIGGLQGYENSMAIAISILCTIAILVMFFGFRDFIDINLRHEFQRQQVHTNVIFYDIFQHFWIERFSDIFILILALLNSLIIFCLVPVMIRFGNCWTELKNPQFEDMQKLQIPKYTFILLTFQLLLPLPMIALNLNSFTKSLPPQLSPMSLQCVLLVVQCFLQTITYKVEMDRHMYKGLVWAKVLIDQPELFKPVQQKIAGLFKGMVVVSYQLLAKIIIPILLMTLLLQKSQTIAHDRYLDHPAPYQQKDFFCFKNNATIFDVLRGFEDSCQEDQVLSITVTYYFVLQPLGLPKSMMRRIQLYSLISKSFIYTIVQFFFFNYMVLTFTFCIFYIFFVNKTQTVGASYKFNQESPQKQKELKEAKKELKKEQKKQIKT